MANLVFAEWLNDKMQERSWSQSELARRSGLSQATVSMVLSGDRSPGPEFLLGVSDALNVPEIIVFQKAGILPDDSLSTPNSREASFLFRQLSDRQQKDLLAMMRALVEEKQRGPIEAQEVGTAR